MDHEINKRVKEVRTVLRLNQHDFSEKLGIKQGSLSDIERYKVNVSSRIVESLYSNVGVNKEWLYTGIGDVFIDTFYQNIDGKNTRFNTQNGNFKNTTVMNEDYTSNNPESNENSFSGSSSKVKIQYIFKATELLKRDHKKLYELQNYIKVIQAFPDATWEINSLIDNALQSIWNTNDKVFDFNEYLKGVVNSLESLEGFYEAFQKLALSIDEFYEDLEKLDDTAKNHFEAYKLQKS